MTSREFFITTLKDELPRFDRVFCAVPDKSVWKPHESSRTALEILQVIISDAESFRKILEKGKIDSSDFARVTETTNPIDLATEFKKGMDGAIDSANAMTDKEWDEPAIMTEGEKTLWETTKGQMAWSFLLDQIHHRGQLSVYLRPMGAKVPAIYGPSGDAQK